MRTGRLVRAGLIYRQLGYDVFCSDEAVQEHPGVDPLAADVCVHPAAGIGEVGRTHRMQQGGLLRIADRFRISPVLRHGPATTAGES